MCATQEDPDEDMPVTVARPPDGINVYSESIAGVALVKGVFIPNPIPSYQSGQRGPPVPFPESLADCGGGEVAGKRVDSLQPTPKLHGYGVRSTVYRMARC